MLHNKCIKASVTSIPHIGFYDATPNISKIPPTSPPPPVAYLPLFLVSYFPPPVVQYAGLG